MASTNERILVIESDPEISGLIARQALKPLGYDVRVVDQAARGIQAAIDNPPDLILANLDLPDLGGKDVLAALSAQGVTAPLVVIAAKGQERRAIQAFRLGATDALLWPARDAEVVRVVERALQPTRSRRIRRQLYQQLNAAHEELTGQQRTLASILELISSLSAEMPADQLLGRLLEHALELAAADIGWLTVRDEKSGRFLLRLQRNLPAGWARKLGQPIDDGLSHMVVLSGRPLTMHGSALEPFGIGSLGKSAAVLPVRAGSEVLAVLIVVRKADEAIERAASILLQGLAAIASVGLARSRLYRALDLSADATRLAGKNSRDLQKSLQAAMGHLATLEYGPSVDLSQQQKEALRVIREELERIAQAQMSTAPGGVTATE